MAVAAVAAVAAETDPFAASTRFAGLVHSGGIATGEKGMSMTVSEQTKTQTQRRMAYRMAYRAGFLKGDDGALLVFGVVGFAFLIGMAGLVFDVGRITKLHSQAASYVDRVALSAAGELDGRANALDRAVAAALGNEASVQDNFRFSFGNDQSVGIQTMVFLSELQANDAADPFARSPLPGDSEVARWEAGTFTYSVDPADAVADAVYVVVTATTETEDYLLFPVARFLVPGIAKQAQVAPQAVAGFVTEICRITPVMICNPNDIDSTPGPGYNVPDGTMVRASMQGGQSAWGPGIFGFLDIVGPDQMQERLRDGLSRVDPNTACVNIRQGVDVNPGQNVGPVTQGLNVRFDIYEGPLNRSDPRIPPDTHVTKGLSTRVNPNNCQYDESIDSVPFPRDACFMDQVAPGFERFQQNPLAGSGCTAFNGLNRFGNGEWARTEYWQTNYGAPAPPGGIISFPVTQNGTTTIRTVNYADASRYDVYRFERTLAPADQLAGSTDEVQAPTCSASPPQRDRRVLAVAVVNCIDNQDILNGNAEDVPVETYAGLFLTEPLGVDRGGVTFPWVQDPQDFFFEFVGEVDPGGNDPSVSSSVREFAVLYR